MGNTLKLKTQNFTLHLLEKYPYTWQAVGEQATKTAAKHTDCLITITKPDQSKEIFDIFDKAAVKEEKDPDSLEKIAKPKTH
jgi:coenzyme F420-dependent glucose-6-phosphate dehydrogenase